MAEEEYDDAVYIMETEPGPPSGRPRWYCYEREPGFDTPEEGVEWAAPRFERVMVAPLAAVYYWVGQPPSSWDPADGELRPWPPSTSERRQIDRDYEATIERFREASRLAPNLARAIADRLNPVLPESWSVDVSGPDVALTQSRWQYFNANLRDQEMEVAYLGVLDGVQSAISEETTDAWPHDPDRGMHMWEPEVRRVGDRLEAWYGPEENPVLTFDPIRLMDLRCE